MTAVVTLAVLAALFGALLGYASVRFRVEGDPIADKIDALLPQSQCGQCGYPGCRPYAEAVAVGEADINLCAPGGEETMLALADLLGREPKPVEIDEGEKIKKVAFIREEECIGCTLCIQACPVDAIIGAAKQMHTVIADQCTGCELCVPPCPVECIEMIPVKTTIESWKWPHPEEQPLRRPEVKAS